MRPTEWAPVLTTLTCRQHVRDMQAESYAKQRSMGRPTLPYMRTMSAADPALRAHHERGGREGADGGRDRQQAHQGRARRALRQRRRPEQHARHLRRARGTEAEARALVCWCKGPPASPVLPRRSVCSQAVFCLQGVTHATAATQNSLLAVSILITRFGSMAAGKSCEVASGSRHMWLERSDLQR